MKNSKLLFAAIAALALLASCNKEHSSGTSEIPDGYGRVSITLKASGSALTKAANTTLTAAENKISNYELLIFNSNGEQVNAQPTKADYSKAGSGSITLDAFNLPEGSYTFYAIVNSDGLVRTNSSTLEALKDIAVDLKTYNDATDLIQVGSVAKTIEANKESSVTVEVKRLVSRVNIATVTNNVPEAWGKMQLKYMYLTNVPGNQNIGCDAATTTWENPWGMTAIPGKTWVTASNAISACTVSGFASNSIAHAASQTFTEANSIYTYPNALTTEMHYNVKNQSPASYTASATYLAICLGMEQDGYKDRMVFLRINGLDGINSGALKANHAYTISSLTINNLPPTKEDIEDGKSDVEQTEFGSVTATIKVINWEDGGSAEYTY